MNFGVAIRALLALDWADFRPLLGLWTKIRTLWGVKESHFGNKLRFSALFLWLYNCKAKQEIGLIVDILRHPPVKFLSQLMQTSSQYSSLEDLTKMTLGVHCYYDDTGPKEVFHKNMEYWRR